MQLFGEWKDLSNLGTTVTYTSECSNHDKEVVNTLLTVATDYQQVRERMNNVVEAVAEQEFYMPVSPEVGKGEKL